MAEEHDNKCGRPNMACWALASPREAMSHHADQTNDGPSAALTILCS